MIRQEKVPSVMTHQFSRVPEVEIPRSSFDRSHGLKTTFDGGKLIPILVDEVLPGDTFTLKMDAFARLSTPLVPIMDNMFMDTFFFFVPNRLIWDNWQKFNGEQTDPGDSIDFTVPTFDNGSGVTSSELHDHMGVPPNITDLPFSALPARCYNLIWNEWFRDENLQDSAPLEKGDTASNVNTDYILRNRGKRHDYFTSALPWPQKGDPVSIPLGTSAPVVSSGTGIPLLDGGGVSPGALEADGTGLGVNFSVAQSTGVPAVWDTPSLETDLTGATAATINSLRLAFQVQKLLERDSRGGTRYTEIIRSHFGVISPDQRLQRPEYLGGGSHNIDIQPVAETTTLDFGGEVGQLGAFGVARLQKHGFSKSFTEHGYIIGLVSVRADLTYQQGLPRHFSRQTRYDYYWPSLAHIGEQEVLNKEIYAQGTSADDDTFGYQERYAEYRYKQSLITSTFRSDDPFSLDVWHLSQDFASLPLLNDSFIQDNPPIDRIVITPAEKQFKFDAYFTMRCARPMPLYGVPGFIDHF